METKTRPTASMYDLFILVITLISIVVAAVAFWPNADSILRANFQRLDLIFSAIFMGDFLFRWWHSAEKQTYFRQNWIDFLGSLPAVPILRIFRILRVWRILRHAKQSSTGQLWHQAVQQRASSSLWGMLILVVVAIIVSGIWIERLERSNCVDHVATANICSLDDGIWWAFVTVTTVGYGDQYPVSDAGRIMAAVLMTIGVGLFGVLTSYFAAMFVVAEEQNQEDEIKAIRAELAEIKAMLMQQQASQ